MGQKNAKPPRVLEAYTSFDVLPTEYFNRRHLQNQYTQAQPQYAQPQQPVQPQQHVQPQQLVQPQPQFVTAQPQYNTPVTPLQYNQAQYTPVQEQARPYQIYGQAPLVQEFGFKQPDETIFGRQHGYSNQVNQQQLQPRNVSNVSLYGNNRQFNVSKKHLGLAPSSSQQIQSVPKFNRSGFVNNNFN